MERGMDPSIDAGTDGAPDADRPRGRTINVSLDANQRAVCFPEPITRLEFFQVKTLAALLLQQEAEMERLAQEQRGLVARAPATLLDSAGRLRT